MNYLLSMILFLHVVSAQAGVYKWVDESGAVHYGDRPESGSQAVEVQQSSVPDKPAATDDSISRDEKRQRISDMLEEDRIEKNKEQEKKRAERDRKKQECNRLKDRQRHVTTATGVYKLDKDGNRVFMSNEQRKKSEAELRKRIQKTCG